MTNPNAEIFVFCPSCGRPALFPRTAKSFSCRECEFVFYINCAAAAMALIFNDEKNLLVTRRKKDPAKGRLDLPGGFAEPGETIEQGLARELKEELNLDLVHLEYLCSASNTYPYEKVVYPITDMAFVCRVSGFENIRARDDVQEFLFVNLADFDLDRFGMPSPKEAVRFYMNRFQGIKKP